MITIRYLTAGESHGKCLTAIIEGMPAQINISKEKIDKDLFRRQQGYGRGGRMQIERDQVDILSGIRHGKTMGSPITLQIANRDWENWEKTMSPTEEPLEIELDRKVVKPRPGHADLSGAFKYRHMDMRNVLERASARETAIRVAVGSAAKQLLEELGIGLLGYVVNIGGVSSPGLIDKREDRELSLDYINQMKDIIAASPCMCIDSSSEKEMISAIEKARASGDSLGGIVEVVAIKLPPGIGSYVHWDRKLDAKLAYQLMSIQAIKGVEFGLGFSAANLPGSQVHDSIYYEQPQGFYRQTNGAGGVEGGMTNGEPLVVRAAMKPIPTLYKPLNSVEMTTKKPVIAAVERSDTCAVPACSVVAESVVAWVLAEAIVEKFGGDSLDELKGNLQAYLKYLGEV